jgi:HlyD family secretion protein
MSRLFCILRFASPILTYDRHCAMQNAKCKMQNAKWVSMLCCLAATAFSGCRHEEETEYTSSSEPPSVQVTQPEVRKIVRVVGQPSFIEAYERSSVYPKMSAYIKEWMADIGDLVEKGDVLATLFVPEVIEDLETKKATVVLDEEQIELALKMVDVAAADVEAAKARLVEAEAILADYQSQVDRWDLQVKRLGRETKRGVVDPQILLESQNQLKASKAARDKAEATIVKARAELLSEEATLAKAKVDVDVARADLLVAKSEVKRLEAWVGYLVLPAPFDGLVVARNANTYDFVLPITGDPTAMQRSPYLSPANLAAPVYVVDRIDIVRIFVDIPEQDADYVETGTKATVLVRGYSDEEIPSQVTRMSWALNVKSRTLRAEIDLPNPEGRIRPGMYAYGNVVIERPGVWTVPIDALDHDSDQTYCWMFENGNAHKVKVETGVDDGEYIEVTRRRVTAPKSQSGWAVLASSEAANPNETQKRSFGTSWMRFDGSEKVILGDLSLLDDGEQVKIGKATKASNNPHGI